MPNKSGILFVAKTHMTLKEGKVMTFPRAVFLDRDGTLIEDRHYLSNPSGVTLLPGVGPALSRLTLMGCRLFMLSNQSGIGRGYFSEDAVHACQKRLEELLVPYGVFFTEAVWCPHAPEARCTCRKPRTGLWEALRERYQLHPKTTVMIGDKVDDLAFAVNAGFAAGVLVLTGKGLQESARLGLDVSTSKTTVFSFHPCQVVAPNLEAAAAWCASLFEHACVIPEAGSEKG